MFRAGTFVIFRDQNLYLGFELTEYEFPKQVFGVLDYPTVDKFGVTRQIFLSSLEKLSVVNSSPDICVSLELVGTGTAAQIHVRVVDATGRESMDAIGCTRDLQYSGTRKINVHLTQMRRIIRHFKTENIILTPTDKSIIIHDESEAFRAHTILTIMPDEVRTAVAETAKAEAKKPAKSATPAPKAEDADVVDDESLMEVV